MKQNSDELEVSSSENLEKAAAIHLLEIIIGVFTKQGEMSFSPRSLI